MDGVLSRWDESMVPALQSMECPAEKGMYDYNDIWPLQKNYPYIEARCNMVMSKQGFWTGLRPYEAGLQLYKYIAERFDTYILTKALKECSLAWKEKVDWLHKYIGNNIHIMVVTDKKLVKGDLMVDDLPKNAEEWLKTNPNGRVIMPIRPYNKDFLAQNVSLWSDGTVKRDISDFGDIIHEEYDFSVPHKIIYETLNN